MAAEIIEAGSAILSEVKDGLVRIAIAYTDKFEMGKQKFSISLEDLEEMAANLAQREVPLDYQHYSGAAAQGQPVPPEWIRAAGWIKKPDTIEDFSEGRKILWGWAEFTPRCLAAIRAKELRYFSPEFTWAGKDEHGESTGTTLHAGAILIRPFLKDLPPIEISAADYPSLLETVALAEHKRLMDPGEVHPAAFLQKKENTVKNLKMKTLADGENKGKHGIFEGDEMLGMLSQDDKACSMCGKSLAEVIDDDAVKMAEQKAAQERCDVVCLAEFGKAKPGDMITMARKFTSQGKLSMDGYLLAQMIAQLVDGAIAKGKVLPKQRPAVFAMAAADYDNCAAYLNDAQPVLDLTTRGVEGDGETSAKEAWDKAVTAYMSENKCDLRKAAVMVGREHPGLYNAYQSELQSAPGVPLEKVGAGA